MDPDGLRAFARRAWRRAAALDRGYWAERHREEGSPATVRASEALWIHMRTIRPTWPEEAQRQQDLDHHVRFKQLLERAARVFPAR